jgi:ribonuclease P protein component
LGRQYTLGNNERLKSRKSIEQLFKEGQRFSITPFRVLFAIDHAKPAVNGIKFGVTVSSKQFRKAVDRNRIKRLVRESYRLQKLPLVEMLKEKNKGLQLFIIYTAKEMPDHKTVYEKVHMILKKLHKQINENISSNS